MCWDGHWLVKVDSQGNEIWRKEFVGDSQEWHANSIQETRDGRIIILGGIYDPEKNTGYTTQVKTLPAESKLDEVESSQFKNEHMPPPPPHKK